MRSFSACRCARALLCLFALASLLHGSDTRVWSQSDQAAFDKGDRKNLSLSSDGHLRLAPQFDELLDSSSVYLWALVGDSKGNLYDPADLVKNVTGKDLDIAPFIKYLERKCRYVYGV